MSKTKSISEQIEEMQKANERLKEYEKLFDKACQINFGSSAKTVEKKMQNSMEPRTNFENKIRTFFGLKTEQDLKEFVRIMCTESTLNFYRKKREDETAEQAG